jgi:phage gp16-like protein
MKPETANDIKKREVRLIKIGQRELMMEDDTYRAMLRRLGGVDSATDLDWAGRKKVLDHLRASGFKKTAGKHRSQAPRKLDRSELMQKIEAQLADTQRPWEYAHSMAKHMFKVDHLDFCTPDHLHRIVAALEYDARRRAKAAAMQVANVRKEQ